MSDAKSRSDILTSNTDVTGLSIRAEPYALFRESPKRIVLRRQINAYFPKKESSYFSLFCLFFVKKGSFSIEILSFSIEILSFFIEILSFSIEILSFFIEILSFSIEILVFSIEKMTFFSVLSFLFFVFGRCLSTHSFYYQYLGAFLLILWFCEGVRSARPAVSDTLPKKQILCHNQ